jgi:ABC-type uncharacterized transport system permease subunit
MNTLILTIASSVFYAYATLLQWRSLKTSPLNPPVTILATGVVAVILHGYQLILGVANTGQVVFTLLNTLSFVALSLSAAIVIISLRLPLHSLKLVTFPLAIVAQLAARLLPEPSSTQGTPSVGIYVHIGLSMTAYAFLSLATLQALLLYWQNHELKAHRNSHALKRLPPLETTEKILFQLIWLGVIVLSLAITTGSLYVEDLFAQHLAHKTILTIISWLLFSLLLCGRYLWGWRGLIAARMTLISSFVLMTGFLGSKFVLQVLLS